MDVSTDPTLPVPAILGAEAATGPAPGLPVTAALVEVPVPNSDEFPVTTTVRELSTSDA